jgi:hypothetical protein
MIALINDETPHLGQTGTPPLSTDAVAFATLSRLTLLQVHIPSNGFRGNEKTRRADGVRRDGDDNDGEQEVFTKARERGKCNGSGYGLGARW